MIKTSFKQLFYIDQLLQLKKIKFLSFSFIRWVIELLFIYAAGVAFYHEEKSSTNK